MKALAIVALALALEAGFLLQISLPGPDAASAAPARAARGVEAGAEPLAARIDRFGALAPCAP